MTLSQDPFSVIRLSFVCFYWDTHEWSFRSTCTRVPPTTTRRYTRHKSVPDVEYECNELSDVKQ